MKIYLIFLTGVLMLAFSSCKKELDFRYHDIEPITVIEGELTPDGITVSITLTTPMDEPMDRTRLTDASVILTDLSADEVYPLSVNETDFFTAPVTGIAGHCYRLTVERNGCLYESETRMYSPVEIKELEFNWIKMPYDYVAILQARFTDNPASEDYYWVKLYRNKEIYKWSEMDDRGTVDNICTFMTMTSRKDTDEEEDDEVLFDGDVLTCSLSPISKEMHDYLEALQHDSNGPAMFTGNKCLGYFMATSPVSESIIFHPDEIPVYK